MAKQTINIGTVANDGTGDRLRTAMDKVNDNFDELYNKFMGFKTETFANPLTLDGTTYKDFKCSSISGNTTINLTNVNDGDGGVIELIITGAGGYTVTLGAMFTKKLGTNSINTDTGKDNFIDWEKIGTDIRYTINTV